MKTIPFLALFAVLTLTSSYVSTVIATPTQQTASLVNGFEHFRVHRQGNAVALSWAVGTPDVVAFTIERSYDGEFFEPINQMSCSGSSVHKFNDEAVYPGVISYRIVALHSDGSVEHSAVKSLRIVQRR